MATLQWGHVFIWVGIGFILLLTGIIISSIRRSLRTGQLSKIPRKAMTAFKQGFLSKVRDAVQHAKAHASARVCPMSELFGLVVAFKTPLVLQFLTPIAV